MPSYRGVYDHKTFGYIQLITNGFQSNVNHFKINCFQKTSEFINFAVFFVLFCPNVTEPNNGLVHRFSSEVQIVLFSFSFI